MMKQCKKCLSLYSPGRGCPNCRRINNAIWAKNNYEKSQRWIKTHPEYQREWRRENSEYNKEWNLANGEYRKQYYKKWKLDNLEQQKEYHKEYKKENAAKVAASNAQRRSSKLQATPKWLTKEQFKQIQEFYERCPKGYHVDHIVPLQGENVSGLHVPWNLQILSASDNIKKSNKLVL